MLSQIPAGLYLILLKLHCVTLVEEESSIL